MTTDKDNSPVGLPKRASIAAMVSLLVVVPCFWQRHIESGDLGSHVYNAWLVQLVEQGRAPGIYVVTQWKNVLFDLVLFHLGKIFGWGIAEKFAVSICVLVFFWGVFAFVSTVVKKSAWTVAPLIAMLAYGYVFYMGFMNYYLSIGLASFALSLMWSGSQKGFVWAVLLAPIIQLAHPLGFLWFVGTASYRLLWMKLEGRKQLLLPVSGCAIAVGVCVFFLRHPGFQADWLDWRFYLRNGADQLAIFGGRFVVLTRVLLVFVAVCALVDVVQSGRNREYWKERRLTLELYFVTLCVTAFLPENLHPDPNAGWIGLLVTRLTVISAIFALCWLASLQVRAWDMAGYGAVAIIFFVFAYQDTAYLNRLEAKVEKLTQGLPFGTRVLAAIDVPPDYRTMFLHVAERACIDHCFVYSNYEPSTLAFRVRVKEGSPVVTASSEDSEDMQSGTYEVQEEDLPLKQIYQCDAVDPTQVCIRDLIAGENNGSPTVTPAR
jgi:hypothetical protein